jgi:hypothetical protein
MMVFEEVGGGADDTILQKIYQRMSQQPFQARVMVIDSKRAEKFSSNTYQDRLMPKDPIHHYRRHHHHQDLSLD